METAIYQSQNTPSPVPPMQSHNDPNPQGELGGRTATDTARTPDESVHLPDVPGGMTLSGTTSPPDLRKEVVTELSEGLTRDRLEAIYNKACKRIGFENACKKLGINVTYLPLNLAGHYLPASLVPSGEPEIFINSDLSSEHQSKVFELLTKGSFDGVRFFYIPKGADAVVEAKGRSNHA